AGACLLGGLPYPFSPIQILWINLVSDVFPALALVLEPADRDVMRQPPRPPGTPLVGRRAWRHLAQVPQFTTESGAARARGGAKTGRFLHYNSCIGRLCGGCMPSRCNRIVWCASGRSTQRRRISTPCRVGSTTSIIRNCESSSKTLRGQSPSPAA